MYFLIFNRAKVLIKPCLVLNERELADLRLLEQTKVTLQTLNRIDNITISKSYEDVKLNDQEEYEIEFQVPPNIAEITVSVQTTVNIVSKGEKRNFSQSQTFVVNNHSSDHDFCEAFLRNVDGQYQYLIKGKNGEPKRGVLIDFQFNHRFYYTSKSKTLKTDRDGIVELGTLKNITHFVATPRSSRIIRSHQKTWVLPKQTYLNYPEGNTLTILNTESVKLPFKHSSAKPTNLSLWQLSGGKFIENLFGKVKFIKNERNQWGVNFIEISGLNEGSYVLWLKKEDIRINIQVHKGGYWNQTYEFLIKERAMIERSRQRIDCLRIDSIKVGYAEADDDMDEKVSSLDDSAAGKKKIHRVHVELGGDFNKQKTRIHAWAFKFFPYDLQGIITDRLSSKNNFTTLFSSTHFNFAEWKNIYLSNRQLSDENRYIMERKM